MKVRLAKPAQRQARKMDAWWRAHRPEARNLFAEELRDAQRQLVEKPDLGQFYVDRGGVPVRRRARGQLRDQPGALRFPRFWMAADS